MYILQWCSMVGIKNRYDINKIFRCILTVIFKYFASIVIFCFTQNSCEQQLSSEKERRLFCHLGLDVCLLFFGNEKVLSLSAVYSVCWFLPSWLLHTVII